MAFEPTTPDSFETEIHAATVTNAKVVVAPWGSHLVVVNFKLDNGQTLGTNYGPDSIRGLDRYNKFVGDCRAQSLDANVKNLIGRRVSVLVKEQMNMFGDIVSVAIGTAPLAKELA